MHNRTLLRRFLLCGWLGGATLVCCAASAGLAESESPDPGRLVSELGNPDFSRREVAEQRLLALGAPALDALYKGTRADDPEVRRRAAAVYDAIDGKLPTREVKE